MAALRASAGSPVSHLADPAPLASLVSQAIDGLDEAGYLTSTTAMDLTEVPESMLVLGGGYVALEQAQLFARLGSQVTVLVRSRLASKEEPEVSRTLQEVFADEGIRVVRRAVPTRPSTGSPRRRGPI